MKLGGQHSQIHKGLLYSLLKPHLRSCGATEAFTEEWQDQTHLLAQLQPVEVQGMGWGVLREKEQLGVHQINLDRSESGSAEPWG